MSVQSLHMCNGCTSGGDKMQFGSVLRKMRKSSGMSQEDLAEELHMSRSNVSRLETYHLELKAADLIRWANVTHSQEMLIALLCGVDSLPLMQQIIESVSSITSVGSILLGGLLRSEEHTSELQSRFDLVCR